MKSRFKQAIRQLLRPLVRKFGGWVSRFVASTVCPLIVAEFERRVCPALDTTTSAVRENIDRTEAVVAHLQRTVQENTLLLDSLVRELVRVQMNLENLEQLIAEESRCAVPSDRDLDADSEDALSAERLMIG
jgi:hypothetical protein